MGALQRRRALLRSAVMCGALAHPFPGITEQFTAATAKAVNKCFAVFHQNVFAHNGSHATLLASLGCVPGRVPLLPLLRRVPLASQLRAPRVHLASACIVFLLHTHGPLCVSWRPSPSHQVPFCLTLHGDYGTVNNSGAGASSFGDALYNFPFPGRCHDEGCVPACARACALLFCLGTKKEASSAAMTLRSVCPGGGLWALGCSSSPTRAFRVHRLPLAEKPGTGTPHDLAAQTGMRLLVWWCGCRVYDHLAGHTACCAVLGGVCLLLCTLNMGAWGTRPPGRGGGGRPST